MQIVIILRTILNTAINAIIELNILYKIAINYCSIKMQIVIILRTILNTAINAIIELNIFYKIAINYC